jgi:sugar lactone lactonase YvrE
MEGNGQAQFKSPTGVAAIIDRSATSTHAEHDMSQGGSFDITHMKGDRIIVVDTLNNRVQNLRSFGRFLTFLGKESSVNINSNGDKFDGQFNQPSDAAIDQESNIYIADGKNNRVIVLNQDGKFLRQWNIPKQVNTMTEKGWFAHLVDNLKSSLFGIERKEWFSPVMSIAAGPDNNIFVADFYNGKILKFNQGGLLLNQFGISDGDDVRYTYSGVDVAYDGTVFVSDYKHQQVHVWRPDGWTPKNPKDITNKSFKIFHTDSGHAKHH